MCDTFISINKETSTSFFGKNSDREPNEVQVLEFHRGKEFENHADLSCTYIDIPQAKKTYDILISRPIWMWGAEIGINEFGVSIGNEAVWTKNPYLKEAKYLTGMDLLRLALERSKNANEAVQTIIKLLEKWDQGGPTGYYNKNFYYHNSFIITDGKDHWQLETSGKDWASKKLEESTSISNGLTIEDNWTNCSLQNNSPQPFNFKKNLNDRFYTTFAGSKIRQKQSLQLIHNRKNDLPSIISVLQSHKHTPYNPSKVWYSDSICAHAGNSITRESSQTTSSIVIEYNEQGFQIWATSTSSPCLSVFKPIIFDSSGTELAKISESLWVAHEYLYRQILKDYSKLSIDYQKELKKLQNTIYELQKKAQNDLNFNLTQHCFDLHEQLVLQWFNLLKEHDIKQGGNIIYRSFWNKMNKRFSIEQPSS